MESHQEYPETLVDAHVHIASSDEQRYPRQPSGLGSTWWQHASGAEELLGDLDACGVGRAVVVQAVGVYGYDCRYAADVASGNDRLAFVGAVDLAGPDPAADFERLRRSTELSGLRLFAVGAAGTGWLTDGTGARLWELASHSGCVLVPTVFPDALGALRQIMERYPEVDVAVDHSAFVHPGAPEGMGQLLSLAELPRLHLKVTSHNLDTDEDPASFLDTLVSAFGAKRVCWGSDHPQHQKRSYAELLGIARTAARNLGVEDRGSFLGGNAARLWWRPSEPDPARGPASEGP